MNYPPGSVADHQPRPDFNVGEAPGRCRTLAGAGRRTWLSSRIGERDAQYISYSNVKRTVVSGVLLFKPNSTAPSYLSLLRPPSGT